MVVVGAGACGCALASRLVERGARVELIEAGPDPGPREDLPPVLLDADAPILTGEYDWGFRTASPPAHRSTLLPRGRVVGGSSATNSCVALRPPPADFQAWAAVAGEGWSWESVLPYFMRVEADADFGQAPHHGTAGRLPVIRWRRDELEPPSAAFLDSALAVGHAWCEDLNAPRAEGAGLAPMNRRAGERVSAAVAYLDCVRGRSNLTIRSSTTVVEVEIRRGRVSGVVVVGPGGRDRITAGRVVLCAGSYCTPSILLRSGIGPADELVDAGIDVCADLPGVGRGLADHSQVHMAASWPGSDRRRPCLQTLVRSTTVGSNTRDDMLLCLLNYVELDAYAPGTASTGWTVMLCALLQSAESRGVVRLGADGAPRIELDHLASAADARRHRAGARSLWRIAEAMDDLEHVDVDAATIADDASLDDLIARRVQTAHHPMGTARMGAGGDVASVVDPGLSVHGVTGLSVADASVIPVCVRANTHLTCLMIGELAADRLASGSG